MLMWDHYNHIVLCSNIMCIMGLKHTYSSKYMYEQQYQKGKYTLTAICVRVRQMGQRVIWLEQISHTQM